MTPSGSARGPTTPLPTDSGGGVLADDLGPQALERCLGPGLDAAHWGPTAAAAPARPHQAVDRPRTRRRIRIRRQEVNAWIERSRVKPGDLRHLHPETLDRYG